MRLAAPSLALLALAASGDRAARAAEPVEVTNFPRLQQVRVEAFPELQRVERSSHAPVTSFVSWTDIDVSPAPPGAGRDDLERFEELGRLEAAGFRSLRACLAGRRSGSGTGDTKLELVLLPEVPFVIDAWKKEGVILLAERLDFELVGRPKGLLEGFAPELPLRFPAYRAFLRNDSPQAVELDLYLQLGE